MALAARLRAVTTRVAAARLDLVDRAFHQFTGLENLPQLTAILCRQVTEHQSLGGGIGNRQAHSWLSRQSIHRIKLTLSRCTLKLHEFLKKVQDKMQGGAIFF